MPLLDLDELPRGARPLPAVVGAPAGARRGSGGPTSSATPEVPLHEAVGELLAERLGRRPAGPVRLLALPRFLGVGFNPVSFLFCHRPSGELDAIVAEVTNTPWGERHAYVLDARGRPARQPTARSAAGSRSACTSPPSWAPTRTTSGGPARPGDSLRLGFRNLEDGRAGLRGLAGAAPA